VSRFRPVPLATAPLPLIARGVWLTDLTSIATDEGWAAYFASSADSVRVVASHTGSVDVLNHGVSMYSVAIRQISDLGPSLVVGDQPNLGNERIGSTVAAPRPSGTS